jgi:hypothetical protein
MLIDSGSKMLHQEERMVGKDDKEQRETLRTHSGAALWRLGRDPSLPRNPKTLSLSLSLWS